MKKKTLYILICCLFGLVYFSSCKKDNYLTDGGLHDARTPLTTYEYLKQHKYRLFDTLIMVIDHYNLKDEVNAAPTFFAPTNYSINAYLKIKDDSVKKINENNKYGLSEMYQEITADSIRIYMVKTRIELPSTGLQPTTVTNGANMPSAVQRIQQPKLGDFSSVPVFSLFYIKVRGALDPTSGAVSPDLPDIKVQCQTTGILPSSGGVLHVLSNQHKFVRF